MIQGSGTISPALGLLVEEHSVSFSGTGLGNIAGGRGTVSGSCGPLDFALCVCVLTGPVVDVACSSTVGFGQGECVFRPHQVFPVESYDLTCEASTAGVEQ